MNPVRRRLLHCAALVIASVALPVQAETLTLKVMTSYPAEVTARMEAAFEKAYPQYRLQIIWRMPQDALPYLQQPKQGGVDVYWSPSPRTFNQLKVEGALRKLDIDFTGLPEVIGKTRLRDPDHYFIASEIAGFGFAINTQTLTTLGLAAPQTWRDLTNPALAGHILLPNPARVGFAPVLIDIPLQAYGWDAGWALWSEISGNAELLEQGGGFISDKLASGEFALGLSIDFFIASAIANGAPIHFVYPERGGINPAHIAITAGTDKVAAAKTFAAFVLSEQGQQLLTHADIRKLPVRPGVYAQLPADYYRPFAAAARGELDYDNDRGRNRLGVISALFDHHLAYRHQEQRELWQRLHALEAAGKPQTTLRQLLTAAPLPESAAADPRLQQQFRNRLEGAKPELREPEQGWRAATDQRIAKARQLLENP
ncbi:ABC transporter substrate-binding protein [Cellvibrio japonicus]|uniref:Putative regulatory lipoprotein n=1 Tax=Cellvibrio japonicus (strain Ueda107) TaxID=498211 RepID=B3PHN1_CELJU|nr:extracellular solute-binding protein [Cellvibrio japonicus]ACE83038.1 putative regulatory lipoprotein [Cellvibrio japonicus Ueda107]QEI12502.1 extracellular solute-binding protein [Cellvibrio japonicus]QEI16076.1 extracellular solute-binding protein [Cellvibrio japonicus]QEI19654.1 extracellular solute-binding protein [Cellvibrio japonicus]